MIQPPARLGRSRGPWAAAAVLVAVAVAVPTLAVVGRLGGPLDTADPTASAPAIAVPSRASTPDASGIRKPASGPSNGAPNPIVVRAAPGPIAVVVGDDHAWIASAGDSTLRRALPDGTVDAIVAIGERHGPWPKPGGDVPTIGLADGLVWVAGMPSALDLVAIDPVRARIVRRFLLPTPATGVAGGFGAAWIVVADGGLLRADPSGELRRVLAPAPSPLSVAIGDRYVWASRGASVVAIDPRSGRIAARFAAGGGSIAVDAETVWVLGTFPGGRDLTSIDERSLRIEYRSDVATSGFSGIAWALPSIMPTGYPDSESLVAPRSTDSALAGVDAWVTRPVEGVVWRIGAVAP